MKPVLYRYRDSESVIKAMEGYTPGEGWELLYDQAAVDAAVAAERDTAVADALRYRWLRRESVRLSFSAELVAQLVANQAELDGAIRQDAAIAKAEGK